MALEAEMKAEMDTKMEALEKTYASKMEAEFEKIKRNTFSFKVSTHFFFFLKKKEECSCAKP